MSVVRARGGRWHGNQKYVPVHLTRKARAWRKKQSKKKQPLVGEVVGAVDREFQEVVRNF